jgi:hypothetical protein
MALHRLDTEEMVHLTSSWIIRGHPDRDALETEPDVAALVPEIEAAHMELLDTHARQLGTLRQREIRRRQDEVDERHGESIRGIRSLLLGTIALIREPPQLAALRGLKQRLLPDGLGVVKQSYRMQVDQAETVASRLTDSDWTLLGRVPLMGGRSLRDAVEDWLALARELGQLERARMQDENAPVTPEAARAARQRWLDAVQAVQRAADGSKNTTLHSVLARVSALEQRAERRAGQQAAPANEADEAALARFEDVGVDTLQLSAADIAAAEQMAERLRRRGPARG